MRYLMRSPRALLMGDAFTSIADDDYTLFYNPAALAHSKAVEVRLLNPNIGVTNLLEDTDRFKDFPEEAVEINKRIQGIPLHTQLGIAPGIKVGGFLGFNFLANNSTSLMLKNQIHPELDIDYRYDRGFVMGAAYTFGQPPALRRSASRGHYTSIGVGFKYLNREGIKNSYDLFGSKLLSDIASGVEDIDDIKEKLGYSKGRAYGYDFGLLHSQNFGSTQFNFGFSILDIADTRFKKEEGIAPIPDQDMMVNMGVSWIEDLGLLKTTLAFDLHPVNQPIPFARKAHIGAKISIPLIDVMAGWSAGYVNYGVGINLWPIKVTAGFYNVEIGSEFKQEQAKRAVIYFSLFEGSFNL